MLATRGLELVEVTLKGAHTRQVLRLAIDRPGPRGVDIDDCQRVSRGLSELLDGSELIPSAYVLEVSSPGIERPIRSRDDIRRNTGRRIVVTAADRSGKRRSHAGVLLGCDAAALRLSDENDGEIRVPVDEIVHARQEIAF